MKGSIKDMIQKIKKFIVIGVASFTMLLPGLAVPAIGGIAFADIQADLCTGVDAAAAPTGASCATPTEGTGTSGVKAIAARIVTIFSIIVGAISIIMIIYGGFRYITSGGDSGKVGNAKNTLLYALVGLIIVALAQLIVRFVLTQTNSVTAGA